MTESQWGSVDHLDNPAVANAVEEISGAAAVLDVASLFAPAVVDACLGGVVCPGRDLPVKAGDGITLLGTADELHAAGLRPRSLEATEGR